MNKYLAITLFVLITFFGCKQVNKEIIDCKKYENENYLNETSDTTSIRILNESHNLLLEKFDESSVSGVNHEAYHLMFYSSHGHGESIKFEKINNTYRLKVDCIHKEWYQECKEFQIAIEEEEWDVLENMIYEFNFWTEEDFRANTDMLDGYGYLLEGNRPSAKNCNKKTEKIILRGSMQYDKIDNLCSNILSYEEVIKFRYQQKGVL